MIQDKRQKTKDKNEKGRFLSFIFYPLSSGERGITLLLVVVILSVLFSISIGIFNVVLGQIKISGEIADSFVAFYAADQGIEKMLFRDRITGEICPTPGINCFPAQTFDTESGACYTIRVSKTGGNTEIITSGQYRCGTNPLRVVKRGFQVNY
ncbi:MAG: hypothetical protein HYW91_01065 [Candidatus Sungbacteria bacterium]|nr:hypothetical protein [Candidatus Sungbacteria bacterium]